MIDFPLLTAQTSVDAVVLGDGDFPRHSVALALLRQAPYVCCCDGAGAQYISRGGHPHAIVGDGDSLSPEFQQRYADILHLVKEQDSNDLTKATRHCLEQGLHRLAYLGTTGKREDHTLGNISLLAHYAFEMGVEPVLVTDYGYFVAASGRSVFGTFARQQVSIFNLSCTRLSGEGFRWSPFCYQQWWQGTLNEAVADEVTLDGDGQYMVFRTFDAKL